MQAQDSIFSERTHFEWSPNGDTPKDTIRLTAAGATDHPEVAIHPAAAVENQQDRVAAHTGWLHAVVGNPADRVPPEPITFARYEDPRL
jgi:hypothetical protein